MLLHVTSLGMLVRFTPQTQVSPPASRSQLGLATEEGTLHHLTTDSGIISSLVFPPAMPEGRGAMKEDAEALVLALDDTKQKLT